MNQKTQAALRMIKEIEISGRSIDTFSWYFLREIKTFILIENKEVTGDQYDKVKRIWR